MTTVFLWQQILGEVEGEQLVHRVSPLHYIRLITRRELYLTCGGSNIVPKNLHGNPA